MSVIFVSMHAYTVRAYWHHSGKRFFPRSIVYSPSEQWYPIGQQISVHHHVLDIQHKMWACIWEQCVREKTLTWNISSAKFGGKSMVCHRECAKEMSAKLKFRIYIDEISLWPYVAYEKKVILCQEEIRESREWSGRCGMWVGVSVCMYVCLCMCGHSLKAFWVITSW